MKSVRSPPPKEEGMAETCDELIMLLGGGAGREIPQNILSGKGPIMLSPGIREEWEKGV